MPKLRRRTMTIREHDSRMRFMLGLIILMGVLLLAIIGSVQRRSKLLWPIPHGSVRVVEQVKAVEIVKDREDMDTMVADLVDKYFESPAQRSEMRMIMHCLLYRETKHDLDKGHGDGGKAGGPLQFHQPTWVGYRNIMISRGLVDEVGDRYNQRDAIETTIWAIKDGRAFAWGPILRWSKGNPTANACPSPSWY